MTEVKSQAASTVPIASIEAIIEASVLLVDDQPARLLTYESILQGVGVTCVCAQIG
jgi:hypothetical protein